MIYETYSCKNLLNYFSPQHIYLRFVTSKKLPFQQCITSQRFQLLNLGPFCPLLFKKITFLFSAQRPAAALSRCQA